MADARIQDLPSTAKLYPNDLFVLQQGNEAKSMSGNVLQSFLDEQKKGNPPTLKSTIYAYQISDSGSVIPSGPWLPNYPPVIPQGKYLWTRTTIIFDTGSTELYNPVRQGIDGTGSVSSVAGVSPNPSGDVPLTPQNIGAQAAGDYALTSDITPKVYNAYGLILNSDEDDISAFGSACVTILGTWARVEVSLRIEKTGENRTFTYGINRDALRDRNPNIPIIIPASGGTAIYYNADGTVALSDPTGFGGTFDAERQFWKPARVYQTNGAVGVWENTVFNHQGMRIVGTCYGRVEG